MSDILSGVPRWLVLVVYGGMLAWCVLPICNVMYSLCFACADAMCTPSPDTNVLIYFPKVCGSIM